MVTRPPSTRSMHLLNGRRVRLTDLIDAKLLEPGAALSYTRARIGDIHRASVTASGRIRLEDGEEFRSPSRAAAAASGARAVAGWHVWTVEPSGRTLDALRRKLLDQVSSSSEPTGSDEDGAARRIHEWLRQARTQADARQPERVSVRDLLSRWGAKGRGDQISRIEADLANHGLVTSPSFRKVTLDATVSLLTFAPLESAGDDHGTGDGGDSDDEDTDGGMTIGNLPSALSGVQSVPPTATLDHAVTTMLLNDFSQLAVLSGGRNLRGAVTWKSIAQARHTNPAPSLADVTVRAPEVPYDDELIDTLSKLEDAGFVFVRNEKSEVAGIVTTADVVHAYGELSTPFFLIGQLDRLLRRILAATFDFQQVLDLCDPNGRRLHGFDDLSMGDYQRVLESPERWRQLGWPLDRSIFIKRLDEMREVRNDIMHFNPYPPTADVVDKLRHILRLLRDYSTQPT